MACRDTNKYVLIFRNKIVYIGITNDLERREKQHKKDKKFTKMIKIGHKVTRASADRWETRMLAEYRKRYRGKNPKYNKTKNG